MIFPSFSGAVLLAFYLLGFTLIAHLFLVNIVLGIAILVPFLEWRSYKKNDPELLTLSQRLFKYLAVSELVAGVWATWVTIILAGYWSTLLFIATSKLFMPITIALIGILISIPSMASYYYLWGKVRRSVHLLIGGLMIIGAAMVPIGFNYIFTFIDDPVGLNSANVWNVMFNPLYPDFTLHRILGGIIITTMIFSALYAIKYVKSTNEKEKSIYIKGVKYGLYIGVPALILETVIGIIYAIELTQYAPYISSAVFGGLYNSTVPTYYQFTPLFIVFMIVIAIIWIGSLYNLRALKRLKFHNLISYMLLVAAIIGLPLGEYLNDASRFPYFVITGNSGIPASTFINTWMSIPDSFAYAAIIISGFLMIMFCILLYWVFIKALKAKI